MVDGLHLNGNLMHRQALLERAREKSSECNAPEWEIAFWRFLSDWFDDTDVMSVQSSVHPQSIFSEQR